MARRTGMPKSNVAPNEGRWGARRKGEAQSYNAKVEYPVPHGAHGSVKRMAPDEEHAMKLRQIHVRSKVALPPASSGRNR